MAQLPTLLCCPTPAINPGMPRPIPVTPVDPCQDAQKVFICGGELTPAPPPTPVSLTGEDCDGAPVSVSGNAGELTAVVQAPGTVFKVQLCDNSKDIEKAVLCDSVTDHKVAVISDLSDPANPIVTYWDITVGAPWTGDVADLQACPDTDTESDPIEMCDSGVEFIRWVVKKDGKPTGVTYDTDLAIQPYVVTDEATVTQGKCVAESVCNPTISSAFGDDLSTLLPGNSIAIQKPGCCAIKVTTSAGDFLVRKGMVAYSTTDFNCPVTVTAVEVVDGTCEVSEVIVTTQAKG